MNIPRGETPAEILVTGGRGKTGARVAARLAERGIPVRIASRSGSPAFAWEDPATWEAALDGVSAVYLAFQPDLAVPGAAETVGAFSRRAVAAGARRLVLLSGRGEDGALAAEKAMKRAGADWTVIRASWFCQNFSESFLTDAIRTGELALPVGSVPEPFVDAEDIADIAVAALTGPGHARRLYEVTGPSLLTFAQATAEIAEACGRPIRFRQVPAEDYERLLRAEGLPAELVALLIELFTEVLDGRNARLTDGVERALGRSPRDFADYARRAAASGAWEASAAARSAAAGA